MENQISRTHEWSKDLFRFVDESKQYDAKFYKITNFKTERELHVVSYTDRACKITQLASTLILEGIDYDSEYFSVKRIEQVLAHEGMIRLQA